MPLPKIDHPIHEVYLKSVGRNIKFRPFLVKEEKLLLVAKESNSNSDIRNAIVQILKNCCLEDINIEELPIFDIEMFFVHLRMRSIGEASKLNFTCENIVEEETQKQCGHVTEYMLNLGKVKYVTDVETSDIVKLSETVGMKLKYPTIAIFNMEDNNEFLAAVNSIINNIEYIYDADSIYLRKDISDEEILQFMEDLTIDQLDEVRKFFNNQPTVLLEDTLTCQQCGFEHTIRASDLYNFFI